MIQSKMMRDVGRFEWRSPILSGIYIKEVPLPIKKASQCGFTNPITDWEIQNHIALPGTNQKVNEDCPGNKLLSLLR